jgi:hypothetical protein
MNRIKTVSGVVLEIKDAFILESSASASSPSS